MENIKIGTRLFITFGILVVILIVTCSLILNQMRENNRNSNEALNKRWELARLTQEAIDASNADVRNLFLLFLFEDKGVKNQELLQKDMKENTRRISEINEVIERNLETDGEKALFNLLKDSRLRYLGSRNQAKALLDQKKYDEAMSVLLNETKPFLDTYHATWRDFSGTQDIAMKYVKEENSNRYFEAQVITGISISLAVILTLEFYQ